MYSIGKSGCKLDKNNLSSHLTFLLDHAPYGVLYFDGFFNVIESNPQMHFYLAPFVGDKSIIGINAKDLFKKNHDLSYELMKIKNTESKGFDLVSVAIGDRYFHISGQKTENQFILVFRDITDQKTEEKEAIMAMLEGQELERKKMAQEIHDGIGPLISSLKIRLQNLQPKIKLAESIKREFLSIYDDIDRIAATTRGISHNLTPRILTDFGLNEAIKTYVQSLEVNFAIDFSFYLKPNSRFHHPIELCLYRIVQESLHNITKHAAATSVSIQIRKEKEQIIMTIEDNGSGFELDKVYQRHLGIGIINMKSRTEALNGHFEISSSKPIGTIIIVEIPLD